MNDFPDHTRARQVSSFAASRPRSGVPARTWQRLSGGYDGQLWLERSAVRTALDLADVGPGDRLLDVGTGTGAVLRQLATRPGRPQFAVGIDTSSAMLSRMPVLPLGWTVLEGSALALPFPASEFTVAVASYVLHVVPEVLLARALSELARVLRRGGRLITVTPVLPERGVLRPLAAAGNAAAERAPALFGGLRAFDPARALEQAGFTLLRGQTLQRGYPSLCVLAQKPVLTTCPAQADQASNEHAGGGDTASPLALTARVAIGASTFARCRGPTTSGSGRALLRCAAGVAQPSRGLHPAAARSGVAP